jgi:predicted RNA-binding protein with PUA-like domain
MAHWLFKTEPSDYSFARLQKEGRTHWTGVRNALALRHLRTVETGDEIFIYHTGNEKSIVGLARASSKARGDSVQIVPVRALAQPVPLSTIKSLASCRAFELVRLPRLSVMPVDPSRWNEILLLERPESV